MTNPSPNSRSPSTLPRPATPAEASGSLKVAKEWWFVGALTVLGGVLRFWKLGHASLWGDEINFVLHSAQNSFSQFIAEYMGHFAPNNFPPHLPVATVIEFVFTRFGHDEFWGRFPAALMGTLTIPAAFVAARRLFDKETGLVAAALVTLSFFLIYYSREANYYGALVFFATTFLAVFWTFLKKAVEGKRVPVWGLILVWVSGTILLQTHLAAVLFTTALGLSAAVICWRTLAELPPPKRMSHFRRQFLPLVLAYLLCWVLVMPWIFRALGLEPSLVDIPPHRMLTFANLLKLPARMGWGNLTSVMAPAAIIFWGCVLTGLWMGFREAKSRRTIGTLVFVVVFIIAIFIPNVRTNGLIPHYLILIVVPILFIAAWGIRSIGEWLTAKTDRRVFLTAIPVGAIIFLAAFTVYPMQLLYKLPGKPTDWRGAAHWMSSHLPKGTVVFFDWYVNVWQHVPTYYPTPGITCASTLPVGTARTEVLVAYRDHTMQTLIKFNDTVYLEAMRLFEAAPSPTGAAPLGNWDWPRAYYRQKKSFRNNPILELDRLGICPIALNYTTMGEVEPILYYNTPEDLIAIHREAGQKIFRRFHSGFGYSKTQDYRDWRSVTDTATIILHNLTDQPQNVLIQLAGVAVPLQPTVTATPLQISIEVQGNVIPQFSAPAGRYIRATPVALRLPPGETSLRILIANRTQNGLTFLVDDLVLELDKK